MKVDRGFIVILLLVFLILFAASVWIESAGVAHGYPAPYPYPIQPTNTPTTVPTVTNTPVPTITPTATAVLPTLTPCPADTCPPTAATLVSFGGHDKSQFWFWEFVIFALGSIIFIGVHHGNRR